MRADIVRWSLAHHGSHVVCIEREDGNRIELHVRYGSLPIASRLCANRRDAVRWSDALRRAWQAAGWK
jgi:hypothetical protein